MKKKLFLPLLLAGMWATPSFASTYVSGSVGLGLAGNSDATVSGVSAKVKDFATYKSAIPFGIAVGLKSDEYRVEVALGQQTNKLDKVKNAPYTTAVPAINNTRASVLSYMVNGYRDFVIKDSCVSPYLTAGLGAASLTQKASGGEDKKTVFAWQAGVGVGIKASDNVVVDLGYRYFKPSELKFPDTTNSLTFSSSNFLAGVRYTF